MVVHARVDAVRDAYTDYHSWPRLFPTISGVRLTARRGSTLVLQVDHLEGTVLNELTVTGGGEVVLYEVKRRYDAVFVNRFASIPAGTLFSVRGDLTFKGIARLLRPFLGWYVRRRIRHLTLLPVKTWAEARAVREASGVATQNSPDGDPRRAE